MLPVLAQMVPVENLPGTFLAVIYLMFGLVAGLFAADTILQLRRLVTQLELGSE